MKLRKIMALALVATGVGWSTTSVEAATTSYSTGSVLLGFYASGGDGAASSYVVKLGDASTFLNATDPISLSLGNIGADLASLYGNNWFERDDLFWGIVGTTGSAAVPANRVTYGTRTRTTAGVVADPFATQVNAARGQTATNIASFGGTYGGKESTVNSSVAIIQANTVNSGFASQLSGLSPFGSNWNSEFLGSFDTSSAGYGVLDFFKYGNPLNPDATGYVGTFSINSSGEIGFAIVPEPSAYLLVAVAGLFLVLQRRRHAVRA